MKKTLSQCKFDVARAEYEWETVTVYLEAVKSLGEHGEAYRRAVFVTRAAYARLTAARAALATMSANDDL